MGQRIAEGDIQINVLDDRAVVDLKRVETQFDRTMAHIDHAEAKAKIEADISPLEDKLKNAKRKLKELEGQRTDVKAGLDTTALDKGIIKAKKDIKRLDGQKATMEIRLKGAEKALATQKALKDGELSRLKATEDAEKQTAKVFEESEKRRMAAVNQSSRVSAALNKQRERELAQAHTWATREDRDRDLALRKQQQEIANVPTLKRQYAELVVNIDRLAKARRKATDEKVETVIDLKIGEAEAKMKALHATLERLGSPVSLEVNLHPGRAAGTAMRNWLSGHQGGGASMLAAAASDLGRKTGESFVSGFTKARDRGFRNTAKDIGRAGLDKGMDVGKAGLNRVGNFMQGISTATVRLGPFTTSIRGLIGVLGVLGPSILDIVGALGSMVSVAGAAALGAGALGVAFVGGAIPALIGFMGVIKPMIAEFKNAKKASDAYAAAVLKHGKGSDQAKKALKELNQTLKGTDKSTVEAFQSASKLGDRWKDLTSPARAAGMNVIGDAINYASKNMGWFARATNDGFKTASSGVRDWIKGLGSAEGKDVLGKLMTNFNGSIGPLMHGLGQIVAYLGRIGAAASEFLPQASRGFDTWATNLAGSAKNGEKLHATMTRLMGAAKSVGQFFMAAGRFLVSFFNPGVEAGQRLTDTMTNALNRWTALNRSTQGRNNLAQFFQQSVTGAQNLYSAFAPLLTSFVRWAALMAPAVSGFLRGAAAVSRFASGIANMLQLQGGISTLAATLGALWAVGRISSATRAVAGFAAALGGVKKAQVAATEVNVAGNVASAVTSGSPLLAGTRGASKAAGEVSMLRKAAILAVPAIAGLGETTAAIATGGLALVAGAAVYGAYKLLTMKSANDKFNDSVKNSIRPLGDYNKATIDGAQAAVEGGTAQRSLSIALDHVSAYKAKLNRLEAQGKKGSDEYKSTLASLNQALTDRATAEVSVQAAAKKSHDAQQKHINDSAAMSKAEDLLRDAQNRRKKAQEAVDEAPNKSMREAAMNRLKEATDQVTKAQGAYNDKVSAEKAAALQAAANVLNYQRAVKGLVPAAGAAAAAMARLYQRNSKLATTIAVKYQDPKDAGAVASRANSALKAGVSQKIVTHIVADSSNADQAIRRLTAQARSMEARKFAIKLGASDEASATIAHIVAKVNNMPTGTAKVKARDQATTTIAKIISRVTGIPDKTARLMARDLLSGKANAARQAIGTIPPSKTVQLNAEASQALAQINLMKSGLSAIQSKSITVSATKIGNGWDGRAAGAGHAAGRGPGNSEKAWVGEGSRWQGAKELIADHKTGSVVSVDKPTLMNLAPTQSVIPVGEQRHRSRGRELMAEFAKDMGFDSFASGRKKKKVRTKPVNKATQKYKKAGLSDYGQAQSRKKARGIAGKNTNFDPDTMPEMKAVDSAKKREDNQGRQISIEESKLQEPSTFLIQTGTDPNGDPIYDVDNKAISDWSSKLTGIAGMYQALMNMIDDVVTAVNKALGALHTVERTAEGNISRIGGKGGPLERDSAIANGKGVSKSRRQAASERIGVYKDYLKGEHDVLTGAQQADQSMQDERIDAGFRKQEATVSRDQYNTDASAVAGKAAADKASSNPQAQKPDDPVAPPTALDIAQGALDAMDANDALAAIGQGTATSSADRIGAYQNVINVAKGMLSDADPTNDSTAYGAITSAANSIGQINSDASAASSAASSSAYQNAIGSSTARQDLFTNFASNFGMAGALGAGRSIGFNGGAGALGQNPAGAAGGVTNNVVVNNSFPTPPADPHTWSQGVAFELQTAL